MRLDSTLMDLEATLFTTVQKSSLNMFKLVVVHVHVSWSLLLVNSLSKSLQDPNFPDLAVIKRQAQMWWSQYVKRCNRQQ